MVYLHDLTDGETSDGQHTLPTPTGMAMGKGHIDTRTMNLGARNAHISSPNNDISDEDASDDDEDDEINDNDSIEDQVTNPEDFLASNTNTLETMSARSFGFVKPSPRQRESEFAHRLKRHKSFFTPNETSGGQKSNGRTTPNPSNSRDAAVMAAAARRGALRRAESFHHSRSLGDFDQAFRGGQQQPPGQEMFNPQQYRQQKLITNEIMRKMIEGRNGNATPTNNQNTNSNGGGSSSKSSIGLSKSKSMEFLKSKLLSRKPSSASSSNNKHSAPSPAPSSSSSSRRTPDWEMRPNTNNSGSCNSSIGGGGVKGNNKFFSPNMQGKSAAQWGFPMDKRDLKNAPSPRPHPLPPSNMQQMHLQQMMERENGGKNNYDWRQDTPFWNKKGRWARPSPTKPVEEAWIPVQSNQPQPPPVHIHPPNGGMGMPMPPGGPPGMGGGGSQIRLPGWPIGGGSSGGTRPSLMGGGGPLKLGGGNFYPSFPVTGVNVSHKNLYLPPAGPSGHAFLGGPHPYAPPPHSSMHFPSVNGNGSKSTSSGSHGSSTSSGGGLNGNLHQRRNNLDIDVDQEAADRLADRLEITELSDEELLMGEAHDICPTPDYSTMQPYGQRQLQEHHHQKQQLVDPTMAAASPAGSTATTVVQMDAHRRRILDMPSGLY